MKNIVKNIIITFFVFIGLQSYSQQEPLYTQYYNNFSLINPAYSGSDGHFTMTANMRSQWSGEAGSPETQSFSLHSAVGEKVGLGFNIVHDKVFIWNNVEMFADFSYTLQVSELSVLSFGLKAGGSFLNVNLQELGITDDPYLSENINNFNPNLGVGAMYFNDKLYASISTINLLASEHYEDNNTVSEASNEMLLYLSAGYVFDLGDLFILRPSFLTRLVNGSPLSTDLSASVLWNNKLEFALSHRFGESLSGLFQVRLNKNIKLGYSYDAITNNIGNYINGSHEVSLILYQGLNSKNANNQKTPFYW